MSMDIHAERGHKVVFAHPDCGYGTDRYTAKMHLTLGEEYTIESTHVGGYHTAVYLQECPGVGFNSVLFDDKVTP